jgi:hypothetical protein
MTSLYHFHHGDAGPSGWELKRASVENQCPSVFLWRLFSPSR